ncbi:MAG TPA: phosphate ABC transporter substrate-binding protein [Anaerovoracaceae bacterium]|nr:phosphate ABC transporter substrate-binding protein [Anaerovoracaceae bacterium]
MKKYFVVLMVIAFMLSGIGCASDDVNIDAIDGLDPIGQIVITGSPTLGQVLTQLVVEFAEENITWDMVDSSFPREEIDIVINGGGSGAGVSAVIDKTASFGLISRNVSEEEQAKFDKFNQYQLGIDALTISVNPENKIHEIHENLTTEELQKIFSGEYKYWEELNPALPYGEIVVVTRDIGGGAHEVFQQKIMGELEVSPHTIQSPSMGALVTKIIENKNAIGYASYGVVNQNKGELIPLLVDGVSPTKENILNGEYKISRPILMLYNGELDPREEALLHFITSNRGMDVIEERGFVPNR